MCFCLCRSFQAVAEKSYFGALTKEKFSDIVVLVTDRRTESEQPKMKKKCYLYTRVSTAAQIEGYSLEAQTEKLRGYAAYRELEIAGEYCDAGKSGRSIKGRPAFQQMLDDIVCEKDGISFVLVFKLSRFGRNAADVLKSMQLLTDCEVDLVCVEDAIDSSTQGGRLTMAILSAVAEIEKENITAQFLSGKMQKLSEGGWPGGPIPYGYRNINKKLVVEPEEAELVRMVFGLYGQEGMMVNSVVNYLNEHGYKKTVRNEQRALTFDMVRTILDNPVYCGKIFYNRRTNCKAGNQKKKDVIVVDGSHEPLVTPEQWHFVRMKRERHKGRGKKTEEPERISLLSGLVKCPKCGSGMIAKKNKSINHNHGGYYKTLYYYGCNSNRKCNGRVCDFSHTYNQEKVDGAVFEIVSGLTMLPVFRERVLHHLGNTDVMDRLETELKKLRKTIRSEEMKKRKLGEDLDNLDFLDDDYDKDYEKLQGEIDRVYDHIEKAEAEMERKMKKLSSAKQGIQAADRIERLLEHMGKLYGHMSCEERRKMYRYFIERIEVYPEHPDGKIIKSIAFRFPVFYGEEDVKEDKAPDEQVVFTLDCGELGLTASEAKATYAQIRKYVSEKFGAKVSSLYIAQVKRKYGLDLGKNYNVSKKTDARVPVCPKDKEGFIIDALKHYKMLDADVEMKEQGDL